MSRSADTIIQIKKLTKELNQATKDEEGSLSIAEARIVLALVRESIGWLQGVEFILDTGRQPDA